MQFSVPSDEIDGLLREHPVHIDCGADGVDALFKRHMILKINPLRVVRINLVVGG